MRKNSSLLKATLSLLILNILLVVFISANFIRTRYETKRLQQITDSEVLAATSIPVFDPSYIMSDLTFSSTRAFPTQASVQQALERFNSPLKNYTEKGQPASYWIFAAARGETSSKWGVRPRINPGVILAYLEKEQSLLSLSNYDTQADPHNRIKTAMGYGCPDHAKCDEQYFGLANQLNWAAYQLQFNFDRAKTGSSLVEPYHINKTISTLDGYNVFLSNAATAANYRYTPHVYWGNYNLWKIVTGYGWGVSSQTYSLADIDRVNLQNENGYTPPAAPEITKAEILPILKKSFNYGDVNEEIRLLQRFLKQEAYYSYPYITGFYGTITQTAHATYNRDHNLTNTYPSSECLNLFGKEWEIGQEGDEVRELQICLQKLGFFDWPTVTSYYGSVTEKGLNDAKKALAKMALNPEENQTVSIPNRPSQTESPNQETPKNPQQTFQNVVTNSRGVNVNGLNLRSEACGNRIGGIGWNKSGISTEGPIRKKCFGRDLEWYKVSIEDQTGWVAGFYLDFQETAAITNNTPNNLESPSQPKVTNTSTIKTNSRGEKVSSLNLRSEACGNRIGRIGWGETGEKVEGPITKTCFGKSWNWYKVRFNGRTGWVADYYLD